MAVSQNLEGKASRGRVPYTLEQNLLFQKGNKRIQETNKGNEQTGRGQ
jgi:hypothetical protein